MKEYENNFYKAIHFAGPNYIPVRVSINAACWNHYPHHLLSELIETHPILFPDKSRVHTKLEPWECKNKPYVDSWNCTWVTTENGITGVPLSHPLADWKDFENFSAPDYEKCDGWGPIDWNQIAENIAKRQKQQVGPVGAGLRHGHTFLTLTYLRGYENLIFDMLDSHPLLYKLIEMVGDFNLGLVKKYISLGVDEIGYPEDLGMQVGPMISPDMFRKYIKPVYKKIMSPAREAGCTIHMHSDGDIRTLAEDLIECGVQVLNLQDIVNGIEWIRDNLKGRICIDLDIDRQNITYSGSPEQIHEHIRKAVELLGDRKGGLMLKYGLYPGVPPENIKAVMDALEKYSAYCS